MSETRQNKQRLISRIAPLLTFVWPARYLRSYGHQMARSLQRLPRLEGLPDLDLAAGDTQGPLSRLEITSEGGSSGNGHPERSDAAGSSIRELLARSNHVIISGSMGCGKTALLRALGWDLACSLAPTAVDQPATHLSAQGQENLLPIFVNLDEFARGDKPPFDLLFESLGEHGLPATRSFLRDCLQQGRCVLLCDNLHRVSDPDKRAQLAEMVRRFGHNTWIIAKRPTDWTLDLPGFETSVLRGTDCCSLPDCFENLAGERSADLAALYAACERNQALRDLARLPLMAAAMVRHILALSGHALRVPDLYEACITACLGEWDGLPRDGVSLSLMDQRSILQAVACEMQQARTWVINKDSLRRLIEEHRSSVGKIRAALWVDSLASEGGILGPVAEGSSDLAFYSPSIQSYLAARQIMDLGNVADVLPVVDLPEWHNTVVLLASMLPDPVPFLQQIAAQGTKEPGKWLLLAHCLAEAEGDTAAIRSHVEDQLFALLEDPAFEDWSAALTALAGMERTRVRDYLESALQSRNTIRKRRAIMACGWLREAWCTPYLGVATLEPYDDLATQAARVLGLIPSSQSARFLARAVKEGPLHARATAARSLVALGRTDPKLISYVVQALVTYLGGDDPHLSQLAEHSLLDLGQAAMPELAKVLNDERLPQTRRVLVAKVLGSLGSEESLPLLIQATLRARHEDLQGYVQAIAAVGPQAVPALIAALEGKDVTRAAGLTWALLAIGEAAVQPVIEALGAPHPEVRNAAARILEQMPQAAIQPLIQTVLADSRLEIRKPALEILGRIGTDEVVSALIKALDDTDLAMRRNAARYLGRFGNPLAVPSLLRTLEADSDPATKRIVITSLGGIRDLRVVSVLIDTLNDPLLRDAAERGLVSLSPLTIEPLIELLHQPNLLPDVRAAAIRVLDSVSHGVDPRDTDPVGLASIYMRLLQQPDAQQAVAWFEGCTWWRHHIEMHRSLQTLGLFAAVDTLDAAGQSEMHLDWVSEIKDWLRPGVREILMGFGSVGENIRLYLQTGRRESQRDALLSSVGKLDELEDLGKAALLPFERIFLDQAVERWGALIHEAQNMLVGRAALSSEVLTPQLPLKRSQSGCTAALRLVNEGDSVARNIVVTVRPVAATDLEIVDGLQRNLDPLGIGEGRQIEITLAPHGVRRAEFQIEVQYDDDEQSERWYRSGFHIEFYDAPSEYRPIPVNPYAAGLPVESPQMFFGRQDIIVWIRENISSQYQENVILLYGERRIGKTSVLRHLLREPPTPGHICLLFDLQGRSYLNDVPSLLGGIADQMFRRLRENGLDIPQPDVDHFHADAYSAFWDYCSLIDSVLDQRRFLIMFDEFGVLLGKVRDGIFDTTLFDFLRGMIQHLTRFNFLFAGAYEVRSLQKDYGSILFNLARVRKVSYLEQVEAEQLVTEPLKDYLSFHPLVTKQICSVTACHPYFIQYICASLVERARSERRNYIELTDLNWAIRDAVRDATGNIGSIYGHLDANEKPALAALANLTDDVRVYAPFGDLVALLERRHLAMPREQLMEALGSLGERDLINETRIGQQLCYSFRMELVRLWLLQNETLLRLAQERAG